MKLALDILGSDKGPGELLKGLNLALNEDGLLEKVFIVGDEAVAKAQLANPEDPRIEYVHTQTVIGMDEHPAVAYRQKKDASITLATKLVKEKKADAIVSAGSTGAQLAAGLFELGRIKGVKRPAIAVPLPKLTGGHVLLLDAGANTEVDETNLLHFAQMGHVCYNILYNKSSFPRIALINNGTEETKGPELMQKSYQLLKEQKNLNFIGFTEGKHLLDNSVDVLVTDGFTGNVVLKTLEGLGKGVFSTLKSEIKTSKRYLLGAFMLKPLFTSLYNKLDAKKVGGAPLLGVNGISIVCHGDSNAEALYNGILTAKKCCDEQIIEKIAKQIDVLNSGDDK